MFRKKIVDAKEFKVGDEIIYCRLKAWQIPKKTTAEVKAEAGERQEEKPHNPRWTQQDIDDAKALRRLHGNFAVVARYSRNRVTAYRWNEARNMPHIAQDVAFLNSQCFPSLRCGETVHVDTILEAEADDNG